jgi:predicted nucleotidyltransferase
MIYPKNKEHFKELIPFAKKIIKILQKNKINVVIYGSFSHFYHTKDKEMKVNDIDLLINKKNFDKVCKILEGEKIKFKYYPKWDTLIIKLGKLKVEIDSLSSGYKTLKTGKLPKRTNNVNFYGLKTNVFGLKDLTQMYPVAYKRSRDDKAKIMKKIKHLENFLGMKLK